ncbi:MAG: transglycosylase SLT domain-containing protein [Blastocatellia bacterium]|nr:transglycosylase SLT domain-containing protein [Blastocatellia bacterium]
MQKHFLICLLPILLALAAVAAGQIRPAQHAQVRAAIDRNDAAAAEQLLREMARAAPEEFARNNYDYLLGRLLERRGAGGEAGALFQKVILRNSPLAGYALWHQAEIARAGGNPAEEQRLLQRFLTQPPDHLLRERAIRRLADSYFRARQYQNVINTHRSTGGPRREAMAMIGEAQLAMRQPEAARATFESVLAGGAMDDASLRACLGLDQLDESAITALSEADRLRRARVYQFNRYFAEARRHWAALVRYFPQSPRRAEALFQTGRGFFLENNFAEAARWYERAHDEFPRTPEGEQGFYYVGHCHQYQDDAPRAIARYEAYLREYPEGEYIGYAHLNAIDTLRSSGRPAEALEWAARAQTITREPFIVLSALFQQARIRLTQENYAGALADVTALRARNLNVRGLTATTNAPELTWLRGYCLERLGRWDEAVNEYLSLPEQRSGASGYYGMRATVRLQALLNNAQARSVVAARRDRFLAEARAAQNSPAAIKAAAHQALRMSADNAIRGELLSILRGVYSRLPGYRAPEMPVTHAGRTGPVFGAAPAAAGTSHSTLANELLFLGLYDEGAPELAAAGAPLPTMAFHCARGNCANRAVKYSEPILNTLPEDFRLELLPPETGEIFFPFPYRDALERHAGARGLDPRFVLSIARQETRYNPGEKSAAAARGMMQFIPSTANQIAAQLNLRDFEQNDLYDADTAILFGSQYMKNLLDEFGSSQAIAASYNGSEESVRRWRLRARSNEVDRLVIEIAKRETKDYVFKVLNFYNAYRIIYPR